MFEAEEDESEASQLLERAMIAYYEAGDIESGERLREALALIEGDDYAAEVARRARANRLQRRMRTYMANRPSAN